MSINCIADVIWAHKKERPETILKHVEAFFIESAKKYRSGLMTEEEFYLATHVHLDSAFMFLINRKNTININHKLLYSEDFRASFAEWKETGGAFTLKQWMKSTFQGFRDIRKPSEWLFKVFDVLKVPISAFEELELGEMESMHPNLLWRISGSSIALTLMENCYNIDLLISDPNPVSKHFSFLFDGGTTVEMDITKREKLDYTGIGTISGYMCEPGEITISHAKIGWAFCFAEKTGSAFAIKMETLIAPIPHPKWGDYNAARLARAFKIEAEYKTLRLPYLVGYEPKRESIIKIVE